MSIELKPKEQLKAFLTKYKDVIGINPEKMCSLVNECLSNHSRGEAYPETINRIFKRWYNSINCGEPDYSVYSDPNYICDVWVCWAICSRSYIRKINLKSSLFGKSIVDDLAEYNTLLDAGCGFGYTTAALSESFKDTEIYGTNLKETWQYAVATDVGKQYGFTIGEKFKKADIVFASEYFEHFDKPIEHLEQIVEEVAPKAMIIANGFGEKAIGHFDWYYHAGRQYSDKQMKRYFLKHMDKLGFDKIETGCFNDRPLYFKKRKSSLNLNTFM